jgi:phytoene synthase
MTLYAFNLEVARIPAVVSEPMLGLIRLQWWRETIAMVFEEDRTRSHEVAEPLAAVIREAGLPRAPFDRLLDARQRDVEGERPASRAELDVYLRDTGGSLLDLAAHAVAGRSVETGGAGFAFAAAAYLEAVPVLGVSALPGAPQETARGLASDALAALDAARGKSLPREAAPALRAGWRSRALLRQAAQAGYDPAVGPAGESPLRRHLSLVWLAVLGRW